MGTESGMPGIGGMQLSTALAICSSLLYPCCRINFTLKSTIFNRTWNFSNFKLFEFKQIFQLQNSNGFVSFVSKKNLRFVNRKEIFFQSVSRVQDGGGRRTEGKSVNPEWFTRLPVRVGSSMRTQPTSSLVTRELTREWAPGRASWPPGRLIGSGQSRLTCLHLRDRNYLKASDSQLRLVAPCPVRFIDSSSK